MAGTVARWAREGKEVVYVVFTNGDKGTSDPDMTPKELTRVREQEQLAAVELLGMREVVFLWHPGQSLEDTLEFTKSGVGGGVTLLKKDARTFSAISLSRR